MARQVYRLDLTAMDFPLLTELGGDSVVIPGLDVSNRDSKEKFRKPQAIFLSNVLPTTLGYKSALISQFGTVTAISGCREIWPVRTNNTVGHIFIGSVGVYFAPSGYLTGRTAVAGAPGGLTSSAILREQTYLCAKNAATLYTCDASSGGAIAAFATTGLTTTSIIGILAVGSYLIAYSEDAVYWSSPSNPSDFVPSLTTGAGFTIPTGLAGKIVACHALNNGFIVYTTAGAISATVSGNAQYPWIFKLLAGFPGIAGRERVSHGGVFDMHLAVTTDGIMFVSLKEAVSGLPEVVDFLRAGSYNTYSAATGLVTTRPALGGMFHNARAHRPSDRYFVISYGAAQTITASDYVYQEALIYDVELKRWGKVSIPHVGFITMPQEGKAYVAEHDLVIYDSAGATYMVGRTTSNDKLDWPTVSPLPAWVIFGKLATARDGVDTFLEASMDLRRAMATNATAYYQGVIAGQLSGVPVTSVYATHSTPTTSVGDTLTIPLRKTAHSHALAVSLNGEVVSAVLTFMRAGKF